MGANQASGARSMEKLSSGLRINRAADDAAGLAISEKMRGQIRGLKQATRNAQDGISLIQTAEGSLNETHSILQRMRELADQAANDTNTLTDRKEIQKEINQLLVEYDRIADNTEFNTQKLLNGTFTGKKLHIGANQGQNLQVDIGSMNTDAIGDLAVAAAATIGGIDFTAVESGLAGNDISITFAVGTEAQELSVEVTDKAITVNLGGTYDTAFDVTSTLDDIVAAINANADASALVSASGGGTSIATAAAATPLAGGADEGGAGISKLAVSDDAIKSLAATATDAEIEAATANVGVLTQAGADAAITNINDAIEQVSAERSKLGALQNRLEHTISNLGTSAENLQAAESRIRDVDMAEEMMAFTKFQILQQASTAMLAQANMAPQSVLQLLG